MYRKLILAVMLCVCAAGCKPPAEQQNNVQETEVNENGEATGENSDADATQAEATEAPTAEPLTVDENAGYQFEEDTEIIIN